MDSEWDTIVVVILLVLYFLFDANYFVRVFLNTLVARFQKKLDVLDVSTIYGICTTQDIDIKLLHLNNARYVRELDFARYDFWVRTGLYDKITKLKAVVFQGATCIRYRRPIPIFTRYKIETRLIYYEETTIFFEQRYISLNDNFVRSINLSRQNIMHIDTKTLFRNTSFENKRPECPEEVKCWMKMFELSSAKLRPKKEDSWPYNVCQPEDCDQKTT